MRKAHIERWCRRYADDAPEVRVLFATGAMGPRWGVVAKHGGCVHLGRGKTLLEAWAEADAMPCDQDSSSRHSGTP